MVEVIRVPTPVAAIQHWEGLGILGRLYLAEPDFTYRSQFGGESFVEGPPHVIQTLVDDARNNCAPWCAISGTVQRAFGRFLVNARERMK